MRISDWSSDVCSSDLAGLLAHGVDHPVRGGRHPGVHPGSDVTLPLGSGGGHRQKSMFVGSSASASAGSATDGPTPSFSRIFFYSSLARSGLSLRNVRAFSLPCPSWSPS